MRNPRWLFAVPAATYLFSYLYLAIYHGKLWLWNTVVHEGGTLTLFQTVFYTSHFLGHIPSLIVIAFLFTGWFKLLSPTPHDRPYSRNTLLAAIAFVVLCFALSLWLFGKEETLAYALLSKQSVTRSEPGGSFLLHFPSTLSLVVLIPICIFFVSLLFRRALTWQSAQLKNIAIIVSNAVVFAIVVTFDTPYSILHALSDPRYLAHSIRELATFPLTFFPIPLALWLSAQSVSNSEITPSLRRPIFLLSVIAIPVLLVQVWVPLGTGLASLAQKPAFATADLSIAYLLTSHYFEHVLDTVFFSLLCFTIIPLRGIKVAYSS